MDKSKENRVLVDFETLIDLDLAIWRYLNDKYNNSSFLDQSLMSLNENQVKSLMIHRQPSNPLEILIPGQDVKNMYYEIVNDNETELLKYATPYDILRLFITFIESASFADFNILCRNKIEKKFIINLNPVFESYILISDRSNFDLSDYNMLYTKYFAYCLVYPPFEGITIYIANAQYNMLEDTSTIDPALLEKFYDVNVIKTMDLYTDIKYIRREDR